MSLTDGTAGSEREEGESEQLGLEERSADRWGPRIGGWVLARSRGRLAEGVGRGLAGPRGKKWATP
jgi:hypothetical protein